jgi:hypothetical protein
MCDNFRMPEFSFERYLDEAVGVEYGSAEPELPINAGSDSGESDDALGKDALAVAYALKSAQARTEVAIARRVPILGLIEKGGWDLTELAPARTQPIQPWLVMDRDGDIYHCSGANLLSHGSSILMSPGALIAKERYLPGHGTVIGNETVRFGLARLVARYIFDIAELPEESLHA